MHTQKEHHHKISLQESWNNAKLILSSTNMIPHQISNTKHHVCDQLQSPYISIHAHNQ